MNPKPPLWGPLLTAAPAAALAFYVPETFRPALLAASILLLFAACFLCRVFRRAARHNGTVQRNRNIQRSWFRPAAAALGIAAGLWAASRVNPPAAGFPAERIVSLTGKLLEDPRSFSGDDPETGRGFSPLELTETGARLPGTLECRASARGRVPVFFPSGTLPRLKDGGRGALIHVEGRFLPGNPGNPGNAPFRASSVHVLKGAGGPEQLRTVLRTALLRRLGNRGEGLPAALLLGSRETLDGDLAQSFRAAGLSHILALSGMHLAFFAAFLALVLRRPLGKRGALAAGALCVILYVLLVGPQPSLVRAAIMYVLGSAFALCGAPRRLPELLAAAFLVQLAWDPPAALTVSFILSYLALGGILLTGEAANTLFRGRLPPFLAGSLGASLGAFLASAPAAFYFFGALYPAGIIAGLAAAPLSGLVMALSCGWLALAELPLLGAALERILDGTVFVLRGITSLAAGAPAIRAPAAVLLPLAVFVLLFFAGLETRRRGRIAPFAL